MLSNLVRQSSTTTGTGNLTLSSVTGWRSFNDAFGTGGTDVFYYFIRHKSAAEWEVGTGHLSSSTVLVRDTVIASSNANALVNFSSGDKDVVNDIAASHQVSLARANTFTAAQTFPQVNVDNLRLDGNTLSSTNSNGNIVLSPNGTGVTIVPAIFGGTSSSDNLMVGPNTASFSPSNTGRIQIKERGTFSESLTLVGGDSPFLDSLFDMSSTITSAAAIVSFSGFRFRPTYKPSVAQILSQFPAFDANATIQHTSGVADVLSYYMGFVSRNVINPDVASGTLSGINHYGFSAVPSTNKTGTVGATIDSIQCFGTYNIPLIGVNNLQGSGNTITTLSHFQATQPTVSGPTITNQYGLLVPDLTLGGTLNIGVSLAVSSGTGKYAIRSTGTAVSEHGGDFRINADNKKLVCGTGLDATIYYDGTNFIIDPDEVGSGRVYIGATGNNNMLLNTIEIDGALDHDGTTVGFYGVTPTTRATGYTTFTNLTTDRTCNANSTTVAELADILGTLIEDLKLTGIVGA